MCGKHEIDDGEDRRRELRSDKAARQGHEDERRTETGKAACEPRDATPANTTTPCRQNTSKLPVPLTREAMRPARISASIFAGACGAIVNTNEIGVSYDVDPQEFKQDFGKPASNSTLPAGHSRGSRPGRRP